MELPDLNKPAFKIFAHATERVKSGKCPMCGKEITGFRDELSEQEYGISGMCQECQDQVFG